MACMCLIWLNMHLFYIRFFLVVILSLRSVITFTLLHFPVSCWLDMASKTCWTVVGYFLIMMRIQTFVLFITVNALFDGMLFFDWDMYDMLWCSYYCVTFMGSTSNVYLYVRLFYDIHFFLIFFLSHGNFAQDVFRQPTTWFLGSLPLTP